MYPNARAHATRYGQLPQNINIRLNLCRSSKILKCLCPHETCSVSYSKASAASMGIFLSIGNTTNDLTKSQKLCRLTESNEVNGHFFYLNRIIEE